MAAAAVTHVFINGTAADAIQMNTNFTDLVDFLNDEVIHADGSKAFTANQPMGGFKITGLGAATANGDAVRFEQVLLASVVDAKGDLIVATAADTPGRLALGNDNEVLVVDTTTATGLKWAAIPTPPGVPTMAYKAADELLTSSQNVLQDDDDLLFAVGANEEWCFELNYHALPTNNGDDLGIAFSIPAGATIVWSLLNQVNTSGTPIASSLQTGTTELTGINTTTAAGGNTGSIRGYVDTAGTAGTVQFRWRNASGGNNFSILKGSNLFAWQLA